MGTEGAPKNNPNPAASHSGLDASGQMRIGDVLTIGVSGNEIELRLSYEQQTVKISETTFAGDLKEKYFGSKHIK